MEINVAELQELKGMLRSRPLFASVCSTVLTVAEHWLFQPDKLWERWEWVGVEVVVGWWVGCVCVCMGGLRCCNICKHLRVSWKLFTRKAALDLKLSLPSIEKGKDWMQKPLQWMPQWCLLSALHMELSMIFCISVPAPCWEASTVWSIYVLNLLGSVQHEGHLKKKNCGIFFTSNSNNKSSSSVGRSKAGAGLNETGWTNIAFPTTSDTIFWFWLDSIFYAAQRLTNVKRKKKHIFWHRSAG